MIRARSLDVDGVMILEFSEEEKRSNEFIRSIHAKANELDLYIETGTEGSDTRMVSSDLRFAEHWVWNLENSPRAEQILE